MVATARLHQQGFECLDLIGWEHAAAILPSVVGHLVSARGAEETNGWRHPIDLVALREQDCSSSEPCLGRGWRGPWSEHNARLPAALLGDDPTAILEARSRTAVRADASPVDLSRSLRSGSTPGGAVRDRERARRLADRASRLHLRQCRSSGPEADRGGGRFAEPCGRGVPGCPPRCHGRLSARYLNVPPARLPDEGDPRLDGLPDRRRCGRPCWTRSTGGVRSMRQGCSSHAILPWGTRPRTDQDARARAATRGRGLPCLPDAGGWRAAIAEWGDTARAGTS